MLSGAFRSSLRLLLIGGLQSLSFRLDCSLGGPPWYQSAAVLFDRGHPCFWNFNSIIPVDVVRVKSYVNGLFNPTGVPMWVSVNKLNLIPEWIVVTIHINSILQKAKPREPNITCREMQQALKGYIKEDKSITTLLAD